jgi:hypothetical protein
MQQRPDFVTVYMPVEQAEAARTSAYMCTRRSLIRRQGQTNLFRRPMIFISTKLVSHALEAPVLP